MGPFVHDQWRIASPTAIVKPSTRFSPEKAVNLSKQLLGLGHYQHRSYGAAVTHLHLVCLAYALLTPLRLARHGAQGQRIRHNAANWSTAAVQDHLRGLIWDDLVNYLPEKHPHESVLMALERLRIA